MAAGGGPSPSEAADTGGETDEDGTLGTVPGSLLPVPWRTRCKHVAPEFAKQEGSGWGMGQKKGGRREAKQRRNKGGKKENN